MKLARTALACLLALFVAVPAPAADPTKKTPKQALQAFNNLIGSWRCTGEPEGTRAEKLKGFWTEAVAWEWRFKGGDAWLSLAFDKGKHFKTGELRPVPGKEAFRLTLVTASGATQTFEGPLAAKRLAVERQDPATQERQRLVFSFLHANRYLMSYEARKPDGTAFAKQWQIGATKRGVPFAGPGDGYPECVVSGGRGTIAVSYKGKTYYVCCTGCRDEFKDNPEKYLKEYEAKKAKQKDNK